jgi:hypothetical protein
MGNKAKYLLIAGYLAAISLPVFPAGDEILSNEVNDSRIHTVQLFREGWNMSFPSLRLNSGEKIELHFDLLAGQSLNYYYTFIHCDKDWKQSDIFVNDFLEGFPENQVEDYKASFNTTVPYFHYKLVFPNDRISFRISGNYIIRIYNPDEPDKPVLQQRFIVSEDAAAISINVRRPQLQPLSETGQQIDFTLKLSGPGFIDPVRNIWSTIIQNGRWDNARTNLKPEFYSGSELKYNPLSDKNTFEGGNEFRYFDIRSIRYLSEYVRKIDYSAPGYHAFLTPSENRLSRPYFYWKDFNGRYYIAVQEGRDHNIEADYLNVYFTLPSVYPFREGDIHITGALTGWAVNDDTRMVYNPAAKQYESTLLLKQGWYNYSYSLVSKDGLNLNSSAIEGSHYETENEYLVVVYYRNPRERYDRVIGTAGLNTLNRIGF